MDLEPAKNNKEIYKFTAIQNKIIDLEPHRTNKNHIPQCTRCQHNGYTRKYCNRPYACVKCGGQHNSADCTKTRDTLAKCALCGGNHPSNYKRCECYHNIISGRNQHRNPPIIDTTQHTVVTLQRPPPSILHHNNPNNCAPMRILSTTVHKSQMIQSPHLPLSLENLKTSSLSSYIKIA